MTTYALPTLRPEPWTEQAACRGAADSIFFPPEGRRIDAAARDAIAICTTCPVQNACLRYAIERHESHGIWGGLTPGQRQKIQRRITDRRTR